MSLLWIEAARAGRREGIEHLPVASLGEESMRRAWGRPDHPRMVELMDRIRGDGGYDPERHGLLHTRIQEDGKPGWVSLPPEHQIPGFGENSGNALAFALHHLDHEHVPVMVTREQPAPTRETNPTRARVFYHGTTAEGDLDQILPASQSGAGVIHWNMTDPDYAYATTDKSNAWHWAEMAHHRTGGVPRVLKVRRRGPVEEDPGWDERTNTSRNNFFGDVRSRHGFDVIGEEPIPHHLRHLVEDED